MKFKHDANMKASLGHTRTRDVTTRPHSKESRPEIWVPPGRRRDTQVEDDPPFPKLLHPQNGATIEL